MARKLGTLVCLIMILAFAAPVVAAEPNTSVTDDMSGPAKWFRRNVIEKPLFFIFGIGGSAPLREAAVIPQSVATQMAKAEVDGTSGGIDILYGLQQGVNGLVPQAFQECVQTPLSATLSFGSSFAGDGYYLVPEVGKPHWFARKNWSNPWWMHQLQFVANGFAVAAPLTGNLLGGSAGIVLLEENMAYVPAAIGGGTLVATNLTQAAVEGNSFFNPVTKYDRVWTAWKVKYPGRKACFH